MYFDPNPKERLSDLFNYKNEFEILLTGMDKEKIVFIKGLRRTGKTSLMKVAMNEVEHPHTYMDMRNYKTRKEFIRGLYRACTNLIKSTGIKGKIKSLIPEEMEVSGVRIKLRPDDVIDLISDLDEYLIKKNKKGILFVDEAQLSTRFGGDDLFASIYDNTKNITIVFSGSEIGLIEEFAGKTSTSPLFGRAKKVIDMHSLPSRLSRQFLVKGFRQIGKDYKESDLDETVAKLDGVIGWLTLYGHYRKSSSHPKALNNVLEDAVKIAWREFEEFLKNKQNAKDRYNIIIKTLSERPSGWGEIKFVLELETKKEISDGRMHNYIKNLHYHSFIKKEEGKYKIADPVIKEAFHRSIGRK